MSITAELSSLITNSIGASGYWAVGILMALDSACCLTVSPEIVMPFASHLASLGHMDLYMAAIAGAVSCTIGFTGTYMVGT